jgi:deoxyadenosine/deoxycytidine kinase
VNPGYFLAIAGNIGVGKTELTTRLSAELGWMAYYEPVIQNPYLDDFYANMERWSFHLQIYFLSERFKAQVQIGASPLPFIQDRTIYEDAEIFARTLHASGAMDDRDFDNYCALFASMTSYLRPPDTIIYLRARVETLLGRIAQRGRTCERNIDPGYLQLLNAAYDDWAERSAPNLRFLVVDTDGMDRVEQHPKIVKLLAELQRGAPVHGEPVPRPVTVAPGSCEAGT